MNRRVIIALCVFWPAIIIILEIAVAAFVTGMGCTISAAGPQPCMILGLDIGPSVYGLFSVGYQVIFALMWIVPALTIWIVVEIILAFRKRWTR